MSLSALGIFSATVNGTAAGTGPDSVTQQEGVGGVSITTYTDVGTGSYTLKFNKVLDPSEYVIYCWMQTVDSGGTGLSNISWTMSTDTLTVKTFDTDAVTAVDAIFSVMVLPVSVANQLGIFTATVNGTAGGTGPDSITQQEGVGGLTCTLYTDVGTGSYTLAFSKVIDPSEYFFFCWDQTVDAAGKTNIAWSVSTNVLTVKTFAVDRVTATDAIFSVIAFPINVLNRVGIFSAVVNGTGGGTGPDSVTQQEGVGGLGIKTYTDNGAGSYALQFTKVVSPSEYIVMLWNQTAAAKTSITGTVATDTLTVSSWAGAAGVTATDAIFSVLMFPVKS